MIKKILIVLISILCCSMTFVKALEIDENHLSSMTIHFQYGDISHFSLYQIAEYKNKEYHLTKDFQSYPIQINQSTSEDLRILATTLSGYIDKDQLTPLKTGLLKKTDTFTWNQLKPGLYLVRGENIVNEKKVCIINPMIIAIPSYHENQLNYDIDVYVKYEIEEKEDIKIEVKKIWKNDNETIRPKNIKVSLLKNNEIYDQILLNKDNNWKYSWNDLSNEYNWNVVEEVVDHYQVLIDKEGYQFIIENSYLKQEENKPSDKIPQTGQLWWPVPVVSAIGISFLIIGYLLKKKED